MKKITKNIEALMARHANAQDCAKTLRRQMATTGRPVVTYPQLLVEQAIACGRRDFEYAKNLSLIFSAMVDQEVVDTRRDKDDPASGHSRRVCQEYLRRGLTVGRIKKATMTEVYRSYTVTDGSCPTAGKPFARLSVMGAVCDALEVLADVEMGRDEELHMAAKADAIEIDMKLAEFAELVRKCQKETGSDNEILVCMDPDYMAVL